MQVKDLVADWPLTGWTRGPLTWDNDPAMLKLAAITEPGAAGTFELVASDAQLCRWSNTLVIDDPDKSATVSIVLAESIGKTLGEIGEIELEE